jgi:hypothetical protein
MLLVRHWLPQNAKWSYVVKLSMNPEILALYNEVITEEPLPRTESIILLKQLTTNGLD